MKNKAFFFCFRLEQIIYVMNEPLFFLCAIVKYKANHIKLNTIAQDSI